jgi:hypothetical protein
MLRVMPSEGCALGLRSMVRRRRRPSCCQATSQTRPHRLPAAPLMPAPPEMLRPADLEVAEPQPEVEVAVCSELLPVLLGRYCPRCSKPEFRRRLLVSRAGCRRQSSHGMTLCRMRLLATPAPRQRARISSPRLLSRLQCLLRCQELRYIRPVACKSSHPQAASFPRLLGARRLCSEHLAGNRPNMVLRSPRPRRACQRPSP